LQEGVEAFGEIASVVPEAIGLYGSYFVLAEFCMHKNKAMWLHFSCVLYDILPFPVKTIDKRIVI